MPFALVWLPIATERSRTARCDRPLAHPPREAAPELHEGHEDQVLLLHRDAGTLVAHADHHVEAGAAASEKAVTARWPAPWLSFVDIHGARITVRTHRVNYVAQCYAENRAAWRAYNRAHGAEQKADPDADD